MKTRRNQLVPFTDHVARDHQQAIRHSLTNEAALAQCAVGGESTKATYSQRLHGQRSWQTLKLLPDVLDMNLAALCRLLPEALDAVRWTKYICPPTSVRRGDPTEISKLTDYSVLRWFEVAQIKLNLFGASPNR